MFKKSPASHVNRIAPPPTHFIVTRGASVEARIPASPFHKDSRGSDLSQILAACRSFFGKPNLPCHLTYGNHASPVFLDRKSTRLNSSHVEISYAVFCLKKKKK